MLFCKKKKKKIDGGAFIATVKSNPWQVAVKTNMDVLKSLMGTV